MKTIKTPTAEERIFNNLSHYSNDGVNESGEITFYKNLLMKRLAIEIKSYRQQIEKEWEYSEEGIEEIKQVAYRKGCDFQMEYCMKERESEKKKIREEVIEEFTNSLENYSDESGNKSFTIKRIRECSDIHLAINKTFK